MSNSVVFAFATSSGDIDVVVPGRCFDLPLTQANPLDLQIGNLHGEYGAQC